MINENTEQEQVLTTASGRSYVRIPYISYLRAVACFAIVVLHTTMSSEILFRDGITAFQDDISMFFVYACIWAVPCFVMVTGALMLDPENRFTIKELFTVYIWRILKALILCCLVFKIFDIIMNGEAFTPANILQAFVKLFTGTSWSHMWYLYMLIGLYLFMPFFKAVTSRGTGKMLIYMITVSVIFISIVPLIELSGVKTAFIIPLATIFPVYLFMGYAVHNDILKLNRAAGVILTAAALILTVLLVIIKRKYYPEMPEIMLGGYASLTAVIFSAGVFALMKDVRYGNFVSRVLYEIDRCSFGIYLLHMIFIRLVLRYWGFDPYQYGVWAFIAVIIGVFAVTFVLVNILKRIPVLNKIL